MRLAICLAVVFLLIAPAWAGLGGGFRLEPVATGLNDPVAMAVTPEGDVLIAERGGSLRMMTEGVLLGGPVCTVSVDTSGTGGLLGVAVHPDFLANRWFYLYYTSSTGANRVTRYELENSQCKFAFPILSDLGTSGSGFRNGGGLAFAPDGKLIVSTGDVEVPSNGQNDTVVTGKVLRVNDDGSIPADNPDPASSVYAKGIRDGVSVAVNANGSIYAADAGAASDSSHDEINFVPAGGNLGWDSATGDSGGTFDDPLASWNPVIGVGMISAYSGDAFPNYGLDGLDNDHDKYGADRFPGVWRSDDNPGTGVCVGSPNNGLPCTSNADCPPRVDVSFGLFNESSFCEFLDDEAEWCPGGVPGGDDGCDATGSVGVDEPNEDYQNSIFLPSPDGNQILRVSLDRSDDSVVSSTDVFLDSTQFSDCPTGWSAVTTAADGSLLVTANNGSGDALFRIVYDGETGPREVSPAGSPFPLTVAETGVANEVRLRFEDLRTDAMQPTDNGADPGAPVREFTIWQGDLASIGTHSPVAGQDGIAGTAVNDALRETTFDAGTTNSYFLVSARADNFNGTTGADSAGATRAGFATTDLCTTIGEHSAANGWAEFLCGRDFTVVDEHGDPWTMSDLRGYPILLDFSAIWCPPCVAQANVLDNMHQDYKDRGVKIVTVLFDEDANGPNWFGRPNIAECRNWGDRQGAGPNHTFPCIIDPLEDTGEPGNTGVRNVWPFYNAHSAVPTNVIIDTGGQVAYSGAGFAESTIRSQLDLIVGTQDSCFD